MNKPQHQPSAWQLNQAMSVLMSGRQRLLAEDPDLAGDEALLTDILGSDPETCDAMDALDRVLRAAVHAETMEDAAKERAAVIAERGKRYAARKQSLRATAFAALDALGMQLRELPDLTASIRAGGRSVIITDEALLPDAYVKTERVPLKANIAAALKAGTDVPGAEFSNGLPSLSITTK